MADLPPGYGLPPSHRTPERPTPSRRRGSSPARPQRKSKGRDRPVPASHAQAGQGVVQVTHDNAPQVQAILLQQIRDWLIRDHRLLREIAYYARCAAENRKPTDAEARAAIDAPPEKVP